MYRLHKLGIPTPKTLPQIHKKVEKVCCSIVCDNKIGNILGVSNNSRLWYIPQWNALQQQRNELGGYMHQHRRTLKNIMFRKQVKDEQASVYTYKVQKHAYTLLMNAYVEEV